MTSRAPRRRQRAGHAGPSAVARHVGAAPVDERLSIERIVAGGDALAREASGRVVFVPGALPGEQVDVRIAGGKRDFARASLRAVVRPHAERVEPPCAMLHRGCGGCDWQHATATLQQELKVEIVREALRRTGRIADPEVVPAGAVPPWAYRTTMRFGLDATGRPSLRAARSNDLVPLDLCLIADRRLAELLPLVRVPGADELTIRISAATGERTASWTPASAVAHGLPHDVRTGVHAHLTEHVAGVPLRVSAGAFFQSGPAAAELLVATVRDVAADALNGAGHIVDAYGGVGLFASALPLADGARLTLVEGSAVACEDARHNLAGRDAQVVHAAVERWSPVPADVVVADPSRQGLGAAAVDRLAATGAPTLVLVSCDPVALARDVTLLREQGYAPGATHVLDLFPQTHHVEAVTRFDRS